MPSFYLLSVFYLKLKSLFLSGINLIFFGFFFFSFCIILVYFWNKFYFVLDFDIFFNVFLFKNYMYLNILNNFRKYSSNIISSRFFIIFYIYNLIYIIYIYICILLYILSIYIYIFLIFVNIILISFLEKAHIYTNICTYYLIFIKSL